MDESAKPQTLRPSAERKAIERGDDVRGQSFYFETLELKAVAPGTVLAESGGLRGKKQANGQIPFRYGYRSPVTGKARDIECGTWPAMSIREIRRARDAFKQQIAEGVDPRELEKQKRAAAPVAAEIERIRLEEELAALQAKQRADAELDLTVSDMFDDWIERGVRRANDNKALKASFNKHILPIIGSLAVRKPLKDPITNLLRDIVSNDGMNRTAVVVKNDLNQMFRWADDEQPWRRLLSEHGIPTRRIDMSLILDNDYEDERSRVLSDEELVELDTIFKTMTAEYNAAPAGQRYGVVRPLSPTHQLAIWICLSTLCRIGELIKSEWRHVNFNRSPVEFLIPMAKVKGKRGKKQDLMIFLSPFAERCLRRLHELTGHTPWLFPSDIEDGHIDRQSITKSIGDRQIMFRKSASDKPRSRRQENNTLVLAGGQNGNWTPHDMRRTGATLMQRLGIDPMLIDRCQNHIVDDGKNKVRRHYQLYSYQKEKAQAWAALGAELERILQIRDESDL